MKPRLVVVDGPRVGDAFDMDGHPSRTIGRGSTNDIDIGDIQVSQQHCRVEADAEKFIIVDFGSKNGTFVNGVQIENALKLEDGDEIQVGGTRLVFQCSEQPFPQGMQRVGSVLQNVELIPSDSLYLRTTLSFQDASSPRIARDLNVLLRLSKELSAIRRSDILQEHLLDRIFEIVPAEQGAIRLADEKQRGFVSSVTKQRLKSSEVLLPSKSLTERVLDQGIAILSNDILSDSEPSDSLIAAHVHSVLCVPLMLFEKKLGVIYLDTRTSSTPFDERHLELLTAIASIAAVALEHVRYVEWLEKENSRLDQQVTTQFGLIGDGPKLSQVKRMISHAARAGSTVTITGESGTGKELVAWAIHRHSPRARNRFVAVNCGAMSRELVESELFGHRKGAFSGADRDRKGHFEEANGGTIFLDEIGELPLEAQVKLLRVLSSHEVVPVGTSHPVSIDTQVIAATNRSLEEMVQTKGFREDLFYRLNVLRIKIPPLRDRKEDLPALVNHFFQKYQHKAGRELSGTHPDFMKVLFEYDWPGNIRELENAIEYAIVIGESERLRPEDLPQPIGGAAPATVQQRRFYGALQDAARKTIIETFRVSESGMYSEAGRMLGIHENLLHRKVTELGIRSEVDQIRQGKTARKPAANPHML